MNLLVLWDIKHEDVNLGEVLKYASNTVSAIRLYIKLKDDYCYQNIIAFKYDKQLIVVSVTLPVN